MNRRELNSLLLQALREEDPDRAETLLSQGADPNAHERGATALALAMLAWSSRRELFEIVLRRRPRLNRRLYGEEASTVSGSYPIALAACHCQPYFLRRLLECGASPHVAWERSHCGEPVFETLLGMCCLSSACVGLLLDHGADPNAPCPALYAHGAGSRTPLHCACSCGQFESAKLLLLAGADPFALDSEGRAPLETANLGYQTCYGHPKMPKSAFEELFAQAERSGLAAAALPAPGKCRREESL